VSAGPALVFTCGTTCAEAGTDSADATTNNATAKNLDPCVLAAILFTRIPLVLFAVGFIFHSPVPFAPVGSGVFGLPRRYRRESPSLEVAGKMQERDHGADSDRAVMLACSVPMC
jgi:hypothetical protein